VYCSSNNVIHTGQKYTISSPSGRGMSVDYKSVFRLAISRTVLEKWAKSRKIAKFGLILPPPRKFFWGSPKILKPVLGTSFQGLLPEKVWTTTSDLGSQHWGFGPPNFNGVVAPQILDPIFKITPISDRLS